MSTQSSDPGFGRGQTLGVTLTMYEATDPNAGVTIIGTRKEFRDENPRTGVLLSNRPVECIAVKNVSGGTLTAGQVVKFKAAATSGQFSGGILGEVDATATTTNATPAANGLVGIVDEYLTAAVPANEVFWLVVRGPATVTKTSTAVSAGDAYGTSATAGSAAAHTAGTTTLIGYAIETAGTGTTSGRVLVRTTAGF